MQISSDYITLKEAAAIYGYSVDNFRKKAQRGEIPGTFRLFANKPNARWRVDIKILREAWGK